VKNQGDRTVYYHKSDNRIMKIIEELNLNQEEVKQRENNKKEDLDKILNNKNTILKEILDLNKLR
jgi:hypothetical protein